MNNIATFSRRQFLQTSVSAASAITLAAALPAPLRAADTFAPPIALFDKVLHQVGLSLEDSAALVAEIGLDGVDCAVRPSDQIEPEGVKDDLPRYAELLQKRNRKVMLLTTAILNPTSPHARDVLDTARKLGVKYYRLAFTKWVKDAEIEKQLAGLKPQLRDIVALNKELGLCALLQNHSPGTPGGYLGGDLNHMRELVQDFPPAQLGVAFDLGHALIVHGDDWKTHFDKLKSHLHVAYIKDADRKRHFVAFGEGEFGRTDYFTRLKRMNYAAPLSLHIEYDWTRGGEKSRETLARALRESLGVLRKWLAAA
jgi:sugar phosphate isomerase/epimerase